MIEEITERLRKTRVCEILTNGGGYCYIYTPEHKDNMSGEWLYFPDNASWSRQYKTLTDLVSAEKFDWVEIM